MLANPSIHAPLLHTNRWRLPLSCNLHRSLRPKKAPRSSSSLLFSSKSCSFGVRALAESQASEINPSSVEAPPGVAQPFSVKIPVGDRHILVETGHIGRQASGSVTVTDGETQVISINLLVSHQPDKGLDFKRDLSIPDKLGRENWRRLRILG
uniref:Uncharacterized protein n=1 Tax=Vitis vinifera TaxID=29760 RepID=F6HMM8_VITVI